MDERRKHPRTKKEIQFCCYIDGQRFDGASVDLSSGGALLKTTDPIPDDSVVVVIPKEHFRKEYPVMMVAAVKRRPEGLVLRWQRCITKAGFRCLWQFIENFPEIWETIPPLPSRDVASRAEIAFDFSDNRFFTPRSKGSNGKRTSPAHPSRTPTPTPKPRPKAEPAATPKPTATPAPRPSEPAPTQKAPPSGEPAARPDTSYGKVNAPGVELVIPVGVRTPTPKPRPLPERNPPTPVPSAESADRIESPPRYTRGRETGAFTRALRTHHEEAPTEIPVTFRTESVSGDGLVRMMGLDSLFLLTFDLPAEEGGRIEVDLPIMLHRRTHSVKLVGTVARIGRHTQVEGTGIHMRIHGATAATSPGIFERYVKFLYYNSVTAR